MNQRSSAQLEGRDGSGYPAAVVGEGNIWSLALRRLPVFLTGLYTWVVTVLPGVWPEGAPPLARWAALAALGCLAVCAAAPRNLWSVLFGVEGYFLCCLLTWWALREAGAGERPGLFGILGWVAYTLAWGALSRSSSKKGELDPSLPQGELAPRSSRRALVGYAIVSGVLLTPLALAIPLVVDRDPAAVLGIVVTLALLLSFLQVGAELGATLHADGPRPRPLLRLRRALPSSLGLLVLLGLACVYRWWS